MYQWRAYLRQNPDERKKHWDPSARRESRPQTSVFGKKAQEKSAEEAEAAKKKKEAVILEFTDLSGISSWCMLTAHLLFCVCRRRSGNAKSRLLRKLRLRVWRPASGWSCRDWRS